MGVNLKGRSFLTLKDYSAEEIEYLVDLAINLKEKKRKGIFEKNLINKNVALIFEKPSTRTRCSFVVGCVDEGAHPEYLGKNDIQLGHKETVEDTARVLGRMFDGIEFRGFSQQVVEKLAEYSGVPVWNGLTDEDHPTQVLADFMTIKEKFGYLKGLKFIFIGDGRNNVANALMIGCSKMGMDFVIVAPKTLWPDESLVELCNGYAKQSGSTIELNDDPQKAVKGADIIYTDVWVSMGEEAKAAERVALLKPYQVNKELFDATGKEETIFMHCLPAVRDYEVTNEIIEGKMSVVFDEAENRMHTIKAIMVATLGN
ncbi:MAG: ornithine carbamoyltransferase [Candidatus Metalachnospira sp.]|nr:ornithine carbamoyltransferase [Candidatus Metalachnospira sp.]